LAGGVHITDRSERRAEALTPVVRALRDIADALEASQADADAEVERALRLMSDATRQLDTNFNTLADATSDQMRDHAQIMGRWTSVEGRPPEVDLTAFLETFRDTVARFGQVILEYARETIRTNGVVTEMMDDLFKLRRIVAEIDEIADETGLLSINAALEAGRAGPEGRGFKVVATEIRALSKKTKRLDSDINELVSATNEKGEKVRVALEQMAAHDIAPLVQAAERAEQLAAELEDLEREVGRAFEQGESFAETVRGLTAEATRLLQFEDIVSQVIATVGRRQGEMTTRITRAVRELPEEGPPSAAAEVLSSALVDDRAHMPAEQESLDEGEIFLF
jgi:methyl-accepting chemotaxis protein